MTDIVVFIFFWNFQLNQKSQNYKEVSSGSGVNGIGWLAKVKWSVKNDCSCPGETGWGSQPRQWERPSEKGLYWELPGSRGMDFIAKKEWVEERGKWKAAPGWLAWASRWWWWCHSSGLGIGYSYLCPRYFCSDGDERHLYLYEVNPQTCVLERTMHMLVFFDLVNLGSTYRMWKEEKEGNFKLYR